ncbi:unnamed protein product [Vicia faba]|uniref:Zinc finger LSD1-type domain-containing protein n=1 Tax=Vicia faba TaxID=3906 RepID=A0AAV1B302_VICFA|nr:unnamed protein product [Vicia faba]
MSKNTSFQDDVPWRVSSSSLKPLPKIHHSPILRVSHTPLSDYAISIMRHPDPIGNGLGDGAIVEAAGPECLVPGQSAPIKLLGLKVWPIEVDLKFLEPVGRELKALGKDAEGISDAEVVLMSEEVVSHALETIIEEEHVAPKVEKVNDTDTSSHYGLDSGFYMSSFTATIFVVSLVTLGVLLITLLVSLVIMLQSCQSKSTGVIELVNMNNYYSYCRVYSLHAEINRLERYDLPNICVNRFCSNGHFFPAADQVGQVKCGSCTLLLMYPYGASQVRCSSCRFVTEIGTTDVDTTGWIHTKCGFPSMEESILDQLNEELKEKIKNDVYDMAPWKSPSPDGYRVGFYQNS